MPALLTMMSSRPNAADGRVDQLLQVGHLETSAWTTGPAAGRVDRLTPWLRRGLVLVSS